MKWLGMFESGSNLIRLHMEKWRLHIPTSSPLRATLVPTIPVCSSSWNVACLTCLVLDVLALLVLSTHCIWAHSHCAPDHNQPSSWLRYQNLYISAFPSLLLSPSSNLVTPLFVQSLTFQVQASLSLLLNPSIDPSHGKASSHRKELNLRHLPTSKLSHRS